MVRNTSTNPMTAVVSVRSSISTPCAAMRAPPMPVRRQSGWRARNAEARPAACKSPEASPATIITSRTGAAGGVRRGHQRPLDLSLDAQRNVERVAPVAPAHGHGRPALHRRQETFELQAKRLALGRVDRNAFHERLERERRARQLREVEFPLQAIELSIATRQVERQIPTRLEDADFAHSIARHAAGGDVRDGA